MYLNYFIRLQGIHAVHYVSLDGWTSMIPIMIMSMRRLSGVENALM